MSGVKVVDRGDLRKYRTEIPNMVLDMGLTPYALALYVHLKRTAGDEGKCWKSTRTLAKETSISAGKVSSARGELEEAELIHVERPDNPSRSVTAYILDVWEENFKQFSSRSPHEHACSPHERKKEPLEEGKKDLSKDKPKETVVSLESHKKIKAKKISKQEAEAKWEALISEDTHGDELQELAALLAGRNKTGKMELSRAWNAIGQRYVKNRERRLEISEAAWTYGFEVAISQEAPNIGYVIEAAKSYRGETESMKSGRPKRDSIAVIGATDEDYSEESYGW